MIKVQSLSSSRLPSTSNIIVFAYEKAKKPLGTYIFGSNSEKAYKDALGDGFKGNIGQVVPVKWGRGKVFRYIFVGLGPEAESNHNKIRFGVAAVVRWAQQVNIKSVFLRLPTLGPTPMTAQAATEGAFLGSYKFEIYKSQNILPDNLANVFILAKDTQDQKDIQKGIGGGQIFSRATLLARDLINRGPSDTTPLDLIKVAKSIAKGPIKLKVFLKPQLQKMGMGGILGVNRGSTQPPAFLHFTYRPSKGRPQRRIGICGKGITFDSGGLSLKPPKSMETMKLDMSGAAAVFGVFKALSELKPNVEVHGFTPLTENMPGCNAQKPGDILKTFNGKTIEVLNTDAEGRLVLADALGYASKQPIDEILDVATLTGAAVVALGNNITAVLGTDSKLLEKLKSASQKSGEKVWELPLETDYRAHMNSHIADIKNIGRPGEAGTIIGGLFLKDFVDPQKPWAHLDIAGPAWVDSVDPLSTPGGTGVMVRTLLHHILSYSSSN